MGISKEILKIEDIIKMIKVCMTYEAFYEAKEFIKIEIDNYKTKENQYKKEIQILVDVLNSIDWEEK